MVTDPVHKLALVDIAQRWLRLAAQIDAIHASRNPEVPATQVRAGPARISESHNGLNSVRLRLVQSFSGCIDRAFDPIGMVLQFHLTFEFCGQIPLDQ